MGFDAATLVRAGSGIAFIGVGLFAALGGDSKGRGWFGALCAAFGLAFVTFNVLDAMGSRQLGLAIQAPIHLLIIVCAIAFVLTWNRDPGSKRETQIALAVTSVVAVFVFAMAVRVPDTLAGRIDNAMSGAGHAFLLLIAYLAARRAALVRNASMTRAFAALALGVAAFASFKIGEALSLANGLTFNEVGIVVVAGAALVVVLGAWLAVAATPGGRASWVAAWGLGVAALVGLANQGDPTASTVGIVRAIAALVLSFALLGGAVDDEIAPHLVIRKGPLAAGALAVLFIVAQVAQNFFSAQFGLLTGGVVAGTFLFAASPIQRAMERLGDRRLAPRESAVDAGGDITRREDIYLNAVRLALRDRRLTRGEERHLARLAQELGLGPERAHELLVQAEQEAGLAL